MKLSLVGMTDRDAAALSLLAGQEFPGCVCQATPRPEPFSLAASDLFVIDLLGVGLARYSDSVAQSVLQALAGAPAVLLTLAKDTHWANSEILKTSGARVVVVPKPYGAQVMRQALKHALLLPAARPEVVAPDKVVEDVRAAPQAAPVAPKRRASDSHVVPDVKVLPLHDEVNTLSIAEFRHWVGQAGAGTPLAFLRKLSQALGGARPFEICLTLQHSVIVNPAEQWVATNTPMTVILRLCKSDVLASVANIRALDTQGLLKRVGSLGMEIEPLELFLWNLHQEGQQVVPQVRHK